jgi:hypothetical protein
LHEFQAYLVEATALGWLWSWAAELGPPEMSASSPEFVPFSFRTRNHPYSPLAVGGSLCCLMFRLEISMKYISHWKIPPSSIDAAIKKFLETGGAPPQGVKMLGRWHGMNGQGFAISESNDAKAMYEWYAQWANVMEITVTPCVEDAEAGPILASMAQR